MATNTNIDVGGEDDGGPQENEDLKGRLPADTSDRGQEPGESNATPEPGNDPGQEAFEIGSELGAIGEETEGPAPELLDLPADEPNKIDDPGISPIDLEDIDVNDRQPLLPELQGQDLLQDVSGANAAAPELGDVDQAQQAFEQMGQDINAFHDQQGGGDVPPGFGGDDEGQRGGFPEEEALKTLMDSDTTSRNSVAQMLIDHARRIDSINELMERSRL